MRDAAINLRAFPEHRDLIDHAAKLLSKNRSDFMLEAACSAAQAVVLDQVFSVWMQRSSASSTHYSMPRPATILRLSVSWP